jgi:hypothetical protein
MNAKQERFEQYAIMIENHAKNHSRDDPDSHMTRTLLFHCAEGMRESAQGHARYEALRVLNPQQFAELWSHSLLGRNFDELVDELVKAKNES